MGIISDDVPKLEEHLKYALDNLDEAVHRFCVFKESFRTYMIKAGIIDNEDKT